MYVNSHPECTPKKDESMSAEQKAYEDLVKKLSELYHIKAEKEHDFIYEFFEGNIPVFKLIMAPDDTGKHMIIVSFHLDINSVYAIQWYLRILDLCPPLNITHCYYRDDSGRTITGEDAEIVRMYKMEQEVISNWIRENEETDEENLEKQVVAETTTIKPSYNSKEEAMKHFNLMKKGKDEDYH